MRQHTIPLVRSPPLWISFGIVLLIILATLLGNARTALGQENSVGSMATTTVTTTNPLMATTTATTTVTTMATTTTLMFGPGDELTFRPTTASETQLTIEQKLSEWSEWLEITPTATTTVSAIGKSLDFGPGDKLLTFTLPSGVSTATLTFTQQGTVVATFVLEEQQPVPPSSTPKSTSTSSDDDDDDAPAAPPPPPPPSLPRIIGRSAIATAWEYPGDRVFFERHDQPDASFEVGVGWFAGDGTEVVVVGIVRDETLGATYLLVRREADGQIVRRWVPSDSPLVYVIPWDIVNSQYTVPVEVLITVPLDEQHPAPNQLVRRFDSGGGGHIAGYDAALGQWRHVPDVATFQARGYYWCDVIAGDIGFFERTTVGPPYPATTEPTQPGYPNCRT